MDAIEHLLALKSAAHAECYYPDNGNACEEHAYDNGEEAVKVRAGDKLQEVAHFSRQVRALAAAMTVAMLARSLG